MSAEDLNAALRDHLARASKEFRLATGMDKIPCPVCGAPLVYGSIVLHLVEHKLADDSARA